MTLEELDQLAVLLGIQNNQNQSTGMPASFNMTASREVANENEKPVVSLEEQLRASLKNRRVQQEQDLSNLQDSIKNYMSMSSGPDLTPLLALSDQWSGGNLAKSYKAPESAEEKAYKALQYQDLIAKRRSEMTKEELDLLSDLLRQRNSSKQLEALARQGRFEDTRRTKLLDNLSKTVNNDILKDFSKTEDEIGAMQANLEAGDYLSFITAMGPFARQIQKQSGVLSDQDMNRVRPESIDKTVLEIKKYTDIGQPVPESLLKPYKDIISRTKSATAKVKLNELERREREYSKRHDYQDIMKDEGSFIFNDAKERVKSFGETKSKPSLKDLMQEAVK